MSFSEFNIQVDGDVGHLNVAEQINVQHNTYNKLKNCNTHFSCGDVTYNAANSAAQVTRTGAANVNVDDAANINIDGAATVNVAENINVSHFTQNKTVNNTLMGYEQIKGNNVFVFYLPYLLSDLRNSQPNWNIINYSPPFIPN